MVTVSSQVTERFRQQNSRLAIAAVVLTLLMATSAASTAATGSSEGVTSSENPWSVERDEPTDIQIPGVSERPLSAEEGPRVVVSQFDLDIDSGLGAALGEERLAAMRALVESRRSSDQRADGLTIGQMEEIASSLTEYLRNNDFIVAYAYIPTQDVKGGRVTIGVLGGRLGNVIVEGNSILSDERITLPFNDLIGRPLQKGDVESAILFVRDYPGVAPSAVLSPGDAVGTTDLTLRVLEQRFDVALTVDNYGTDATGEGRVRLNVVFNNPLKRGDRLDLNILQTFSPAEGTYGGGSYEMPIGAGGFSTGVLYNTNTFDAEGAGIKLGGESQIGAVFAKQKIIRQRQMNFDVFGDLSFKNSKFDALGGIGDDPEDKLTVLTLGANFEAVDRLGLLGVNSINFSYHHGFDDFLGSMDSDGDGRSSRLGGSGERAGGDFDKVTARYQRLQQITPANALIFRAFGQYSDDLLTSLEQMSMGGPYTVRAYPVAEFLVDRGYFASVDYQLNLSSLMSSVSDDWDINLGVFYDYAYGQNEDPLGSERSNIALGGPGAGFQVEYRWGAGYGVLLRVEAAWQVSGPEQSDGDDPQIWARLELFRR